MWKNFLCLLRAVVVHCVNLVSFNSDSSARIVYWLMILLKSCCVPASDLKLGWRNQPQDTESSRADLGLY